MSELKTGHYYCLSTMLSETDENGATLKDSNGEAIYAKYYFCGEAREPKTLVPYVEWNKNGHYARRFTSEQAANNYNKVVLKTPGIYAEPHPGNLKAAPVVRKPLRVLPDQNNLPNNQKL